MSAEAAVFLPVLTPTLAQQLADTLPTEVRASAQWSASRLTSALRSLHRGDFTEDELDRVARDFLAHSTSLLRLLVEHPELAGLVVADAGDLMIDTAARAQKQLGASIAGAAADFGLRLYGSFMRFIAGRWTALVAERELGAVISEDGAIAEQLDPAIADFLRAQVAALSLCDALERGVERAALARLSCYGAQHFIRSLRAPELQRLPDPYLGETERQRGERMLGYLRVAPAATTDVEREVILGLRSVHFHGPGQVTGRLADFVVTLYGDVLAKLA